jgi:hypothetical protein
MANSERRARARLRHADEVAPKFICCDGMLKSTEKVAGTVIEIFPDQSYRDQRKCSYCGATHEVTGIRMSARVRNCTVVASEWIDIDEGGSHEQ